MSVVQRPLVGLRIGVSISEGEETTALGFPASEINRTTVRVLAALLGQGSAIVLGHDWRDEGIMHEVLAYIERYRPLDPQEQVRPLLLNMIPWPYKPFLPADRLKRLKGIMRIEKAGLPTAIRARAVTARSQASPYLRAIGLTYLREKLTKASSARICLGGRLSKYDGAYPGVVEEAALTLQAQQPLYVSALLGGAAQQIILAIKNGNSAKDLCPISKEADLNRGIRGINSPIRYSRHKIWKLFTKIGIDGLAKNNGLSKQENLKLFQTQSVEQAVEIILTGLGRLRAKTN